MQEAVRRVVEGPPEGLARALDEHVAQRRGHALGAEAANGHRHGAKDSRAPAERSTLSAHDGRLRRDRPDRAGRPAPALRDLEVDLDRDAAGPDRGRRTVAPTIVQVVPTDRRSATGSASASAAARGLVSQTTFYLFDPDSWR